MFSHKVKEVLAGAIFLVGGALLYKKWKTGVSPTPAPATPGESSGPSPVPADPGLPAIVDDSSGNPTGGQGGGGADMSSDDALSALTSAAAVM